MRILIGLGLCSALIAGSAIATQVSAEPQDQPAPREFDPYAVRPSHDQPAPGGFDPYAVRVPYAPVRIIPPRSDPSHPVTQPAYPPESKRLGETGTVVLLLTVDETGKVLDASVKKSSGFDRLDEAAKEEALGNWHLLPGTEAGKPTKMQYPFAVTFKSTADERSVPAAK